MMQTLSGARETLGLKGEASESEIRAQYRRLAKLHHPDMARTKEEKALNAETFIRLSEAASVLLEGEEPVGPHNPTERPTGAVGRRWRRGEKALAKPPTASFEEEVREALRVAVHGPELWVDEVDMFPTALEMEEKNAGTVDGSALLRLVHGRDLVGAVEVQSPGELRLELFGGAVTARACRHLTPTSEAVVVERDGGRTSKLLSTRGRGLSLLGFGGFKSHVLVDHSGAVTHRLFETYYPGVHAMTWRLDLGQGAFFDPVVATVSKAWFPHKRFWPSCFHHFRPDTHASDGRANTFYLERLTSTAGVFVPPVAGCSSSPRLDHAPSNSGGLRFFRRQTPSQPSSSPPLDPIFCVFAAAFHTLDHHHQHHKHHSSSSSSSSSSAY